MQYLGVNVADICYLKNIKVCIMYQGLQKTIKPIFVSEMYFFIKLIFFNIGKMLINLFT